MRKIRTNCIKKALSILISVLIMVTPIIPGYTPKSYAYMNEQNTIRGSNGFIEYLVDKNDGRFIIRTLEGIPQKLLDDNKKLLFERENDPETSFTTFRVDGKNYIFGNKYDGHSEYIEKSLTTTDGFYTQSIWSVDSLEINQILEVIEDTEHPNVGNVRIRYEVTNKSEEAKKVGSRIFLDTMLGDNDGASFVVSGNTLTNETELSGSSIPDYYRSSDDDFAPKIVGYGFLKGWGEAVPDRVVFAHYNNLSKTKWDYTIDPSLDFTSNENVYKGADSSVAYYFNEQELKANETRVYETFYGIGDFSHYDSDSNFGLIVNVPEKLTVNAKKTGYVEEKFTVSVTIDNSLPDSENLTGVEISLKNRGIYFEKVQGQDYTLEVPAINKGEIKTYEFKLSAKNVDKYISEAIGVTVASDNSEQSASAYDYILLPAISGELPNLRLEVMSPSTVYYDGYRTFSIKGKGFEMLNNKGLWELYLVDSNNHEIEIPDENVDIASDEKLSITIYEDTLEETTEVGDYRFKIVHSDNSIGTVISPKDKPIKFSDDKKYMSRPYGVIYVEKRQKDDNLTYHISAVDSKDMLNEIKKSLEDKKGVPVAYRNTQRDNQYGDVTEIVFDVVGDAAELMDGSSKYYTVKTNNQTAIINSVLQYKDADKPLKIKKTNGIVTVEGDGTLKIVGGNEIWWSHFYTYIADGEDYDMNQIVEEPDEEEESEGPQGLEEEESKSNIVIDFFDPGKILTDIVSVFYDGFELEINGIALLNEGVSLGGKLALEIPFGAPVPVEEEEKDPEKEELEIQNEVYAAISDLFLSDEEREAKTKKQNRSKAYIKLAALLLTEDGIMEKVKELKEKSSAPPSEKAEIIHDLILESPELVQTIYAAIKGKEVSGDDDESKKSVGVSIDVKKVLVGKRYGEDYIYDSVKFIGIDAEGEVKVVLPFGTQEDRDEAEEEDEVQGVRAKVAVNTIEGEYSLEADVNLEIVNAHAIISIVKVDGRLVPDHLELSGGFEPGIPVAPPFFINKVGGGVKNLAGQFGKEDSGPLTIIMILGMSLQPSFEGEFRTEVSKNGFSLEGDLEFKNGMKVFEKLAIALQWSKPRYFEGKAEVNLFDIIDGKAYLYVGEVKEGDAYVFYFEGRVEAGIKIPKDVWLVGGKKVGSVKLGVNTKKFWGSVEVIGVGVGLTYVYGKGVDFSVAEGNSNMPVFASLSDVNIPQNPVSSTVLSNGHTLLVGSNIKKIRSVDSAFASRNKYHLASSDNRRFQGFSNMFAIDTNLQYTCNVFGRESILFELGYSGELPSVELIAPSGIVYELIEDVNYLVQDGSIFISVNNPEDGTWTINSNSELAKVDLYDVKPLPKLETVSFTTSANSIDVSFTASHSQDALVSLFLVNTEEEQEAGYALQSNIDASIGAAKVSIPEGIKEGAYKVRAVIYHPDYGYHELMSEETITIVDPYKPPTVDGLTVSYIGDGYLKAIWNELSDEGEIKYIVNVYDSNNMPVQGFKDMSLEKTEIVVGGSYVGIDEQGNEVRYQLEPGKSYKIGVAAVKVRTEAGSDVKTIHIGSEMVSEEVYVKIPKKPDITVTYEDEFINYSGVPHFATRKVDVAFNSDQQVDTNVSVDGEYFATFKGKDSFVLPLEFNDGEHVISFASRNIEGDTVLKTVSFVTDTTKPELLIDSPSVSFISENGTVLVKGMVESGAKVFINDIPVALDVNGNFNTVYTLIADGLKEIITIKAVDAVGNETIYTSEAVNGLIKPITQIRLNVVDDVIYSGDSRTLSVMGIDEDGNEIKLNNQEVEFSVIKGNTIAGVSQVGELTAYDQGSLIVGASYALTDKYSLQDAVEIEVEGRFDYIRVVPEISEMEIGQSIKLSFVGGSKYEESKLSDDYAVYRIIEGSEHASLSGNVLNANSEGLIRIEAQFNDGLYNVVDILDIAITASLPSATPTLMPTSTLTPTPSQTYTQIPTPASNSRDRDRSKDSNNKPSENTQESVDTDSFSEAGELSVVDTVLKSIWKNIVEKEKKLEVVSIREVRKDLNTRITMHNIGRLEIQKGTLDENDQFLVGVVKNEDLLDTEKYKLQSEVLELTFGYSKTRLNNPIELVLTYDKENVQNPDNLSVYYYNEQFGKWQYLGGEVNKESGEVKIKLNHLSKYALIEDKSEDKFMDIKGHFSEDFAKSLYSLGVVEGELSGGYRYYSPDRNLTRLELTAIAVNVYEKLYPQKAANIDLNYDAKFEDGEEIADWGRDFVKKAYCYGLLKGIEVDGKMYFMPNRTITRAESFTIIGQAIDSENVKTNESFTDSYTIPDWSIEHIYKLIDKGLINGYPDGTIRADRSITRGEIAAIVNNWIEQKAIELK